MLDAWNKQLQNKKMKTVISGPVFSPTCPFSSVIGMLQ